MRAATGIATIPWPLFALVFISKIALVGALMGGNVCPADRLLDLLNTSLEKRQAVGVYGVHDALSARVFEDNLSKDDNDAALFVSGFGVSASRLGQPDAGILTFSELHDSAKSIIQQTKLPVIVDGDTGFGGAANMRRTIRDIASISAAAITIEDQLFPKKCTYLAGSSVTVLDRAEAKKRVKMALAAQTEAFERDGNKILIIARTDCRLQLGFDEAVDRCLEFDELGADIVYAENLQSKEEYKFIREYMPEGTSMMLAQVQTGEKDQKLLTLDEIGDLGYEMGLYGVTGLQAAVNAMETAALEMAEGQGLISSSSLSTLDELKTIVGFSDLETFEEALITNDSPEKETAETSISKSNEIAFIAEDKQDSQTKEVSGTTSFSKLRGAKKLSTPKESSNAKKEDISQLTASPPGSKASIKGDQKMTQDLKELATKEESIPVVNVSFKKTASKTTSSPFAKKGGLPSFTAEPKDKATKGEAGAKEDPKEISSKAESAVDKKSFASFGSTASKTTSSPFAKEGGHTDFENEGPVAPSTERAPENIVNENGEEGMGATKIIGQEIDDIKDVRVSDVKTEEISSAEENSRKDVDFKPAKSWFDRFGGVTLDRIDLQDEVSVGGEFPIKRTTSILSEDSEEKLEKTPIDTDTEDSGPVLASLESTANWFDESSLRNKGAYMTPQKHASKQETTSNKEDEQRLQPIENESITNWFDESNSKKKGAYMAPQKHASKEERVSGKEDEERLQPVENESTANWFDESNSGIKGAYMAQQKHASKEERVSGKEDEERLQPVENESSANWFDESNSGLRGAYTETQSNEYNEEKVKKREDEATLSPIETESHWFDESMSRSKGAYITPSDKITEVRKGDESNSESKGGAYTEIQNKVNKEVKVKKREDEATLLPIETESHWFDESMSRSKGAYITPSDKITEVQKGDETTSAILQPVEQATRWFDKSNLRKIITDTTPKPRKEAKQRQIEGQVPNIEPDSVLESLAQPSRWFDETSFRKSIIDTSAHARRNIDADTLDQNGNVESVQGFEGEKLLDVEEYIGPETNWHDTNSQDRLTDFMNGDNF